MSPRFVTIKRFAELTGYTDEAVRQKMKRGDWLERREFRKAPDGRILMDLEAYDRWATQGPATAAELEQLEQGRRSGR